MPANALLFSSGQAAVTAISGTTEAVVATCSGVTTRNAGQTVRLKGWVFLTTGTTTTAVIAQIRRTSLTGTQVGDHTGATILGSAGSTNIYLVEAFDTPGDVASMSYVLTVTNTGGGTGGTTVYAVLDADVF